MKILLFFWILINIYWIITMASLFGGLLSRVIKVRIQGNISQKTTSKILNQMTNAKFINPSAIAIVINSPGGQLCQAKTISSYLKNYSEQKNIPIFSFAEDQCLGSANVLLTTGVKAYATQMTMIGDFNFNWSRLWFKKFADKYNIRQEYIFSGQNKVKFNPYEDMKPQSQKWMQNHLYLLEHDLKVCVTSNREAQFRKKSLQKQELEEKLFKGVLIKPEDALNIGLIDGFKTFDQLMNTTFDGTKVLQINRPKKYFTYHN